MEIRQIFARRVSLMQFILLLFAARCDVSGSRKADEKTDEFFPNKQSAERLEKVGKCAFGSEDISISPIFVSGVFVGINLNIIRRDRSESAER